MSYYALFSLFPLLLVFLSIGGFVLQGELAQKRLLAFMTGAFPISQQLIERNIRQVLDLRGTVGLLALVSLLWSAMGAFSVLVTHINRAWTDAAPRSFFRNRVIALGMIVILGMLLVLSFVSVGVLEVLPRLPAPEWNIPALQATALWGLVADVLPWLLVFLAFLCLYRWVPCAEVRWSQALCGGGVATVGWKLATDALIWFIGSGLLRYELVYGSLGAMVALLVWIYIGCTLVLFGAHLSAAITLQGKLAPGSEITIGQSAGE
jgi:YihY family inner membrane protein